MNKKDIFSHITKFGGESGSRYRWSWLWSHFSSLCLALPSSVYWLILRLFFHCHKNIVKTFISTDTKKLKLFLLFLFSFLSRISLRHVYLIIVKERENLFLSHKFKNWMLFSTVQLVCFSSIPISGSKTLPRVKPCADWLNQCWSAHCHGAELLKGTQLRCLFNFIMALIK
jgi:hypothetical protein